jgi:hypothetical protein
MEMITVSSSNVHAISYSAEAATLQVQFINGGIYEYQGIPQEIYEGLMAAGSKGQFLDQYIKKGGYPYSKIA